MHSNFTQSHTQTHSLTHTHFLCPLLAQAEAVLVAAIAEAGGRLFHHARGRRERHPRYILRLRGGPPLQHPHSGAEGRRGGLHCEVCFVFDKTTSNRFSVFSLYSCAGARHTKEGSAGIPATRHTAATRSVDWPPRYSPTASISFAWTRSSYDVLSRK
jgi:hypothetical protein